MTIRELIGVLDNGISIVVVKDEETVAVFDVAYAASIIDDILDIVIGHIGIEAAYKGVTTLTITKTESDSD